MGEDIALTRPERLRLYEPGRFSQFDQQPEAATTPNQWFVQRYPNAYENHGSPFLELAEPLDQFTVQIMPITINHDFFASVLGGRRDLGHHVIYFDPEMMWYFRDSDGIFKSTSIEKLMNVYRALMMKCAQDMPANVHKINLVNEWRGDRTAKTIILRAKSILAADHSFFSPTSRYQRIRGQELTERVARKFVDEMLTCEPGQILRLGDAYSVFRGLLKQRDLPDIKRSDFKVIVTPLIREQFDVALRNDLSSDGVAGVRGWKNVRLVQAGPG
jgi:hypothetical protein